MCGRKAWFGGGVLVVVLTAMLRTEVACAQDAGGLPPAPVPVVPPPALGRPLPLAPAAPQAEPAPFAPAPPPAGPTPLAYTPPPTEPAPVNDPGGSDWAPYEPPSSPAGFFFDAEIILLDPVLKENISGAAGTPPGGNKFFVPSTSLDVTVSPTIEFGYRLPNNQGFFAGSYRFISSQGTGDAVAGGVPFASRTRLDVEIFDLDYGSAIFEPAPNWDVSWRLGARVANIFFDSTVSNSMYTQQASNNFFGSGIHGRFDVERQIKAVRGLSLFGRFDGSVLVGEITQRFHQYDVLPATPPFEETFRHAQSPPSLMLQVGVSYVPPIFTNVKFTTGYQFEDYWYLGQYNADGVPGASRGELYTNGWFLRGQVDF